MVKSFLRSSTLLYNSWFDKTKFIKAKNFFKNCKFLGFFISHTLSPVIHNGLFGEYGVNALYIILEKEKPTRNLILGKESISLSGLSVTIPHKEWAFKIADYKDEASTNMKASNTLVRFDSKINAYNTDGLSGTFANFLIPLQIGARDMASPMLNMLSYWFFFLASIIMMSSLFVQTGPASGGWTIYPPLSALGDASSGSKIGMDLWYVSSK